MTPVLSLCTSGRTWFHLLTPVLLHKAAKNERSPLSCLKAKQAQLSQLLPMHWMLYSVGWWPRWETLQCEDTLALLLGAQSRTQNSKWGLLIARHRGIKAFPELLGTLLQKLPQAPLSCIAVRARCWLMVTCSLPGSRGTCAQRREERSTWEEQLCRHSGQSVSDTPTQNQTQGSGFSVLFISVAPL